MTGFILTVYLSDINLQLKGHGDAQTQDSPNIDNFYTISTYFIYHMKRQTLVSRRLYKILYLNYYYSIKAFSYCFVKILKFRI